MKQVAAQEHPPEIGRAIRCPAQNEGHSFGIINDRTIYIYNYGLFHETIIYSEKDKAAA